VARRRTGLCVALAAVTALAAGILTQANAGSRQTNAVAAENQRGGSRGWSIRPAPTGTIEGYASEVSVAPGEALHLHVSARAPVSYRVEIYRIGWYRGAGGRRIGCLPSCSADHRASPQPIAPLDPNTGLLRLNWPVTDEVPIRAAWPSGYYARTSPSHEAAWQGEAHGCHSSCGRRRREPRPSSFRRL
jgi:hypothetical protein